MADKRISELNELTTALAGDLLAIVNSGETKKITYGNISKVLIDTTPKTANYTLTTSDRLIFVDATSGAIDIVVPASSGNQGIPWTVKKVDTSSNIVFIKPDGIETIDGANDYRLFNANESVTFLSDGTNLRVISNKT